MEVSACEQTYQCLHEVLYPKGRLEADMQAWVRPEKLQVRLPANARCVDAFSQCLWRAFYLTALVCAVRILAFLCRKSIFTALKCRDCYCSRGEPFLPS